MRAFWLDEERPEDASRAIGAAELASHGVEYQQIPVGDHEPELEAFMREHGYRTKDEVNLDPSTPNLDAILARFDKEHLHDDDEVRYVLSGEGMFDIRSTDDRWMRVVVGPSDLIRVPQGRNHRFFLTQIGAIRAARLFLDASGWTPHYRDPV